MQTLSKDDLIRCVRNSINHRTDDEGYLTFLRFTDKQMQIYEPDVLFHLMSFCSSGVCLVLETNGSELTLECKTIDVKKNSLIQIKGEMSFGQVIRLLGDSMWRAFQAGSKLDILEHFDLYVNDCYRSSIRFGSGQLTFCLNNPDHQWINVKIWFPLYKPFHIRNVSVDGDWRVAGDKQPLLYAFGDSITQGFIAGKPSFCYVAQLAELLGVNALNQGIGGAMFDPHILDDLEKLTAPDLITVAYGTNDWRNDLPLEQIRTNAGQFFERLHRLYAAVPTYILTPIWRGDLDQQALTGPLDNVIGLIREIAGAYPAVRLIDGMNVSPHNPACFADGFLHPNIAGFSYMAPRIFKAMKN